MQCDNKRNLRGLIINMLQTLYPADKSEFIEMREKILVNLHAAGGGHYGGTLSVIDIFPSEDE